MLRELLGIELPIIQAPMAGVQGSALAIAVSNAGGLGSLPCAMLTPEALRTELAAVREQTRRPYNVNFFCHQPPEPDAAREQAWQAALPSCWSACGPGAPSSCPRPPPWTKRSGCSRMASTR